VSVFLFEATTEKQFPLLCNTAHNTKNQNENTLPPLKLCDKQHRNFCKCTTCVNGICKKKIPDKLSGTKWITCNYSLDAAASSTSTVQHGAQHQKSKRKYTTTAQTLRQTAQRCLQMHNLRQRHLQEKIPDKLSGTKWL